MMASRLLPLFLLAALAAPASAQGRRDDGRSVGRRAEFDRGPVDTTVAFAAGGVVDVNGGRGDIIIRTGSANSVTVRADAARGRVRVDASTGRISVDASETGDGRMQLTVPAGVRVIAQTMHGDISVTGTGSDVSAHTQDGDIHVDGASGHVEFNTLSGDITGAHLSATISANSIAGDITLSDVTGNVTATSVSGSIGLERVTSKAVDASTTSGDVTYDGGIDPAGRYSFVAHSGDVTLELPAKISAQLTISTWTGSIDSDFPITLQPGEHDVGIATSKRFTFSIGGGEARIRADSFNGDIVIRRSGGR